MNFDFKNGEVLLINKPLTWTSFNVVKKIRYLIKYKTDFGKVKVGHAGTLDPLATGLIIVCTGKETKQIEKYQAQVKEYIATIKLGATTPSFDLETEIDNEYPIEHITEELIQKTLLQFKGTLNQTPPIFSAKQVNGKRAYTYARKGEHVEMKPVQISIDELEILSEFDELPELRLRIICSKGTYIRSLAHDIGKALNSGAYLAGLCRIRIGNYRLEDAFSIDDFENKFAN